MKGFQVCQGNKEYQNRLFWLLPDRVQPLKNTDEESNISNEINTKGCRKVKEEWQSQNNEDKIYGEVKLQDQELLLNPVDSFDESKSKSIKKKTKTNGNLKNFLNFVKRCLLRIYQRQQQGCEERKNILSILKGPKTNRVEIDNILKMAEMNEVLKKAFLKKKLKREMQLSRIDSQNRKMFREKITLLKKGFLMNNIPMRQEECHS